MFIDLSFNQTQKVCNFSLYNTVKRIPLNQDGARPLGRCSVRILRGSLCPSCLSTTHRDSVPAERKDQPQPFTVAEGTEGLAGRVAQVTQLPRSGAAQQEELSEQPTASQVRL